MPDTPTPPSPHAEIARRIIGGATAVASPAVSPDGRRVACVVGRTDLAANKGISAVWLVDVETGTARPLTAGDPGESQPVWSPCGRYLAFVSTRGKPGDTPTPSTVHVMPVDGPGEVRTVASMKEAVADLRWSPDGEWLAFTSRTPDARYEAKDESWQPPRKIDRFFSRLDNVGWVIDRPSHVYVVPAWRSAAPRDLTPGEFQHHGVAWTADSTAVITSAGRHDTWDLDFAVDLYRVPLQGDVERLTQGTGIYGSPSVSPDGTRVAFLGHDDAETYPQNVRVGVLDLASRAHRWASTGHDRTFEPTSGSLPPVWLDDATLLANAEDRGRCHLVRISADGATAPVALTDGARWVRGVDASGGTVAAVVSQVDRPAELFTASIDASTSALGLRQLTRITDAFTQEITPRRWEHFTVPSADGTVEIDAWIMAPEGLPADVAAGARHPVLLNVHGGPHTQYGETFFDEPQMQAAAGFVVLLCNPRGGSGREESWGQAILGPKHHTAPGAGWGSIDVDDVMSVLDAALERYSFCDPERVGMMGGSYGGFMATELAGRFSHRFRGICSERAVNNLLTEEYTSDISTIFRVEHGPRHIDDPEEYLRLSPIRLVRQIEVPMLIIHSENDLRCPISQAEELFVAMRLLGKEVDFYRFPGEGHELSRSGSPVHRVQRAEIILDWFADKLGLTPAAVPPTTLPAG